MSGSLAIQSNPAAYTPGTVDFQETMAVAQAALKDAYQVLTVSFLGPQAVEVPGATRLEPPKKLSMDANLLLAQLQDTLNQLLQKVSVNDIKQNLQTQNEANKKQLETMQEAAKAASAAAAKAKETEHKLNVWKAVANWVGVAITAASIACTVIAALGQLAVGNVVSASALFVATAAMGVQLTCQVALAIDATMKAAGNEKGLGINVEAWTKVMEIAGYVALAASMVGMIGGLLAASSNAAKQATSQIAQKGAAEVADEAGKKAATEAVEGISKKLATEAVEEVGTEVATEAAEGVGKKLATEAVEEAGTEVATETAEKVVKNAVAKTPEQLAKEAQSTAVKEALKAACKKLVDPLDKVAVVGKLALAGINFAGKQVELNAREEISDFQKEADLKEADAEAMKAMIVKLQAMIQQLQQDLEEQMEKGENVLQSLLTPITDRMRTMETLIQNIGA
jgi:hypothetical protein